MRKISIGIILIGFSFILLRTTYLGAVIEEETSEKDLKSQIQIINLINGLFLKQEQIELIIRKAKEKRDLVESLKKELELYNEEKINALSAIKEELIRGKELSKKLRQKFLSIENLIEIGKKDYDNQIKVIIEELKNNLTENQLYLINTYKPCIIPPKGPGRIGQVEEPTRYEKQLEKVRNLSQKEYESKKKELAKALIERQKLPSIKVIKPVEEKQIEAIVATFDEIRKLNEVDFELKKDSFIKRLTNISSPLRFVVDIDTKIDKFLLNSQTIVILEEKLNN